MKRCPGCKVEKPLSAYYSDTSRKNGVSARCGQCLQIKAALRRVTPKAAPPEPPERPEPTRAPHCPVCVTEYRKHETVPGLYFCANAFCREFDMAKHVRVYVNGARAA